MKLSLYLVLEQSTSTERDLEISRSKVRSPKGGRVISGWEVNKKICGLC